MSQIVFVTAADLSGKTGDSVATREIVAALAAVKWVELHLFSSTPDGDLPKRVDNNVESTVSLPPKPSSDSKWRTILWHGHLQALIAKHLGARCIHNGPELVIARVNPSLLAPPLVTTAFGTPYTILVRGMVGRNIPFSRVARFVVHLNSFFADETYVAYKEVKELVDKFRPSWKPPAVIQTNGVDPDVFEPVRKADARTRLEIIDDEFVVGFVGTLRKRHRTETLIRGAAKSDQDVTLLIVGDGPERTELEELGEQLDIGGSVRFTGLVDHSEVNRYISACDICYGVVDPDRPSNPIKVYEYLACERPVITSESEELAFVDREDLGNVLDEVNPKTVGRAIDCFAESSPSDRREMGRRGRSYIQEHHTWSAFAQKLLPFDM